jgi:hypothetical protein
MFRNGWRVVGLAGVVLLGSVAAYHGAYVAVAIASVAILIAVLAVLWPQGAVDRLLALPIGMTRAGKVAVILLSSILFAVVGPLIGVLLISPLLVSPFVILWPPVLVVAYVQGSPAALITGVLNGIAFITFHRFVTRENALALSVSLGGLLGVTVWLLDLWLHGESLCQRHSCFSGIDFWLLIVTPAGAGAFCAQLFNRWALRNILTSVDMESNNALKRTRGQ